MFTTYKNLMLQLHAYDKIYIYRKHSKKLYRNNVIFMMNYHK